MTAAGRAVPGTYSLQALIARGPALAADSRLPAALILLLLAPSSRSESRIATDDADCTDFSVSSVNP